MVVYGSGNITIHSLSAVIVGPGYPSNVSGTEPLQSYPTWRDLLAGSSGGYSFDKQQQALWIKLLRSDSASIILG